jgi:hypothetical protein
MSTSDKKPSAADARERKRARFEEQPVASSGSNRGLVVIAAIIAVAVIVAGAYYVSNRGTRESATSAQTSKAPAPQPAAPGGAQVAGTSAANAPTLSADGDRVRIPAAAITPTAAFYKVDAGGTVVPFFAVRDASGQAVVALDACNVCAHAKKGYEQKGDQMICKNCGLPFAVKDLAKMGTQGGCHPITLPTQTDGDSIVVDQKALAAGAKYF